MYFHSFSESAEMIVLADCEPIYMIKTVLSKKNSTMQFCKRPRYLIEKLLVQIIIDKFY